MNTYIHTCTDFIQYGLSIVTKIVLWELVHLGTLKYGYTLLAFENLNSVTRAARVINIYEECGLKKHTVGLNPNKSGGPYYVLKEHILDASNM